MLNSNITFFQSNNEEVYSPRRQHTIITVTINEHANIGNT